MGKGSEKVAATWRPPTQALNRLPGTPIPDSAGGGTVDSTAGLIHAGDLIDSGDKSGTIYTQMQQTEWDAFEPGKRERHIFYLPHVTYSPASRR